MTPETQTTLKTIVERAVRPVHATVERKRRMREELLAHVTEVFDEEHARTRDEAAAAEATSRRFGDATQIANELQRSVSAFDRIFSAFERIVLARPGEGNVQRALRWGLFVMAVIGVESLVLLLPAGLLMKGSQDLGFLSLVIAALVFGSAIMVFEFVLLGSWLRGVMFIEGQRSAFKAFLVLVAALVLPGLTVLSELLLLSRDLSWSIGLMKQVAVFIPFCVAVVFLVARKFDEERPHLDEWASLVTE